MDYRVINPKKRREGGTWFPLWSTRAIRFVAIKLFFLLHDIQVSER